MPIENDSHKLLRTRGLSPHVAKEGFAPGDSHSDAKLFQKCFPLMAGVPLFQLWHSDALLPVWSQFCKCAELYSGTHDLEDNWSSLHEMPMKVSGCELHTVDTVHALPAPAISLRLHRTLVLIWSRMYFQQAVWLLKIRRFTNLSFSAQCLNLSHHERVRLRLYLQVYVSRSLVDRTERDIRYCVILGKTTY